MLTWLHQSLLMALVSRCGTSPMPGVPSSIMRYPPYLEHWKKPSNYQQQCLPNVVFHTLALPILSHLLMLHRVQFQLGTLTAFQKCESTVRQLRVLNAIALAWRFPGGKHRQQRTNAKVEQLQFFIQFALGRYELVFRNGAKHHLRTALRGFHPVLPYRILHRQFDSQWRRYVNGVRNACMLPATIAKSTLGCNYAAFSVESPEGYTGCLLYTSPSPRDQRGSRMPSSA